jgi:YfiH family protein
MPFHQSDSIRYYTFDSLEDRGLVQAVFTRKGGVSPQPWQGLNVGGTVGDDPANVVENRRRAFQAAGRDLETNYDVWQVHSAEVVCASAPRPASQAHVKADAILTDRPGVTLFMRFADCVPILLYDPRRKAVGLVHAGWQGTVQRVALAAVQSMQARYGSRPENILAGIGPSIGAHHYEVGLEVAEQVQAAFGPEASGLLPGQNGAVQFDLWQANRLVLNQAGVREVELARICTACHPEDWFSHRAEKGRTGRFGALIGLKVEG